MLQNFPCSTPLEGNKSYANKNNAWYVSTNQEMTTFPELVNETLCHTRQETAIKCYHVSRAPSVPVASASAC